MHRFIRQTKSTAWLLLLSVALLSTQGIACVDDSGDYEPPNDDGQDDTNGDEKEPDTQDPPREDVPEQTEIPDTCNGYAELCERPFDEIAFPGAHNAMSNRDEGWSGPNQSYGLERQLEDGVRVFLLDVHRHKKTLKLCHTLCGLGARDLDDALWAFRDFLRANRGEVIVFILEDYVPGPELAQALIDRGLDQWVYDPFTHDTWPTLGELIADNTRLIVSAEKEGGSADEPSWYVNAWDIMFDNPWTYKLGEDDFSCTLKRGSPDNDLYLLNHWYSNGIGMSDEENAAQANSKDVLLAHAQDCEETHGRMPNFIAVDHYAEGDLFEVVDILNGLDTP